MPASGAVTPPPCHTHDRTSRRGGSVAKPPCRLGLLAAGTRPPGACCPAPWYRANVAGDGTNADWSWHAPMASAGWTTAERLGSAFVVRGRAAAAHALAEEFRPAGDGRSFRAGGGSSTRVLP